ncbi:MAG: 6-pyruvoyl trahydropterin synthase family protein [Planctomycetaceae bacterium]
MSHSPATRLSLLRSLRFCAGHRLHGHEGQCAFFHGHNYRVDVEVVARAGADRVDAVGRVVDFSLIKQRLLGWLDEHWDHAFIVHDADRNGLEALANVRPSKYFVLPCNPTAENMARYLLEVVSPFVLGDLGVVARRVAVWETDEACAIATSEACEITGEACGALGSMETRRGGLTEPHAAVIIDDRGES